MKNAYLFLLPTLALSTVGIACGDDTSTNDPTTANASSSGTGSGVTGLPSTISATTTGMVEGSSSGTTMGVVDDTGTTDAPGTTMGTTTDPGDSTTTSEGSATSPTTDGGESTSSGGESSSGGVDDDTLYEIQDGTIAEGVAVDVRGVVVTAVYTNAFFVQEPAGGQFSGAYVFVQAAPAVAVGDEVDLIGVTAEFNGLTEVDVTAGMVSPTGNTGINLVPEVIALADVGEPWESVLVRLQGAPLTVIDVSQFDEFDVNDGGLDDARVDDLLYNVLDFPADFPGFGIGATFTAVQGPLNFSFGSFKVAPREFTDLEGYAPAPAAVRFAELDWSRPSP